MAVRTAVPLAARSAAPRSETISLLDAVQHHGGWQMVRYAR